MLNWRPYTISYCECDKKFYDCLNNKTSVVAKDIQRIFFDVLEVPCFNIELKDERKCVKRTWFMACKGYTMRTESYASLSSIKESMSLNEKEEESERKKKPRQRNWILFSLGISIEYRINTLIYIFLHTLSRYQTFKISYKKELRISRTSYTSRDIWALVLLRKSSLRNPVLYTFHCFRK